MDLPWQESLHSLRLELLDSLAELEAEPISTSVDHPVVRVLDWLDEPLTRMLLPLSA